MGRSLKKIKRRSLKKSRKIRRSKRIRISKRRRHSRSRRHRSRKDGFNDFPALSYYSATVPMVLYK